MATRAQLAAYVAPPTFPPQGPTSPYDVLADAFRLRDREHLAGDVIQLDDTEAMRLLACGAVGEPGSWAALQVQRAEQAALNELAHDRAEVYAANHVQNMQTASRMGIRD